MSCWKMVRGEQSRISIGGSVTCPIILWSIDPSLSSFQWMDQSWGRVCVIVLQGGVHFCRNGLEGEHGKKGELN